MLVVISGKRATGKSTIARGIATVWKTHTVIIDDLDTHGLGFVLMAYNDYQFRGGRIKIDFRLLRNMYQNIIVTTQLNDLTHVETLIKEPIQHLVQTNSIFAEDMERAQGKRSLLAVNV